MPGADEAGGQSQEKAALNAGMETLSQKQKLVFRKYQKFQLAQDGFVFWVATPTVTEVVGSMHYATDRRQDEAETIAANQMILTSETEITKFNTISPLYMWIGTWKVEGAPPLRVAFSQHTNYYKEADIWHYAGFAVYSTHQTQILDSAADLPPGPIVSNSLPIWLAQNSFAPVYPAFLVDDNFLPPYIAVNIESTIALQAAPTIGPWPGFVPPSTDGSPLHQLPISIQARDEVKLTLLGFSNEMVYGYLASLYEASQSANALFGFSNSPIPQDVKRPQVEIAAIAQQKTLEISANYNQGAADAVARRLILEASVGTWTIIGGVSMVGTGSTIQDAQAINAGGSVFQ